MNSRLSVLSWLIVLAIGILSMIPGQYRPYTAFPSKIEHMAAFILAGGLFALFYRRRINPAIIVIGLTLYGAVLELGQLWIPGRHARFIDIAADGLGALIGVALAWIVQRICVSLTHKAAAGRE